MQTGNLAVKIVSSFSGNVARGLPSVQAVIAFLDSPTGTPVALLEGTSLMALRTGAASGAATDLLGCRDAGVAAILGAGGQARMQLEAECTVCPIGRALVSDTDPARSAQFVADVRGRGSPFPDEVRVAGSPEEAVAEAEIICTATTSRQPDFPGHLLRPGTHINAIGAYRPEMQEVDVETIRRARVLVDSRPDCLTKPADLVIPLREGIIDETHIVKKRGFSLVGNRVSSSGPVGQEPLFRLQDASLRQMLRFAQHDREMARGLAPPWGGSAAPPVVTRPPAVWAPAGASLGTH